MITLAVAIVLLLLVVVGGLFCYVLSRDDIIFVISTPGKSYTIECPRWLRRRDTAGEANSVPHLFHVNKFLSDFLDSEKSRIELTPDQLRDEAAVNSSLVALRGLDYNAIRCRLRVMSSLDPIVNREDELGLVRMTVRHREIKLRTFFAANAASIAVEKFTA